ncbi:MAG: cyclopropane-fatty-acyl-phospholipid synthase family protein [Candidatus Nanoarchaeia archaeon]
MKKIFKKDKQAISYHYDLSADFYRLFLGDYMVYSCAYFEKGDEDINTAQLKKMEYICRKLNLKGGENLLDIGCGFGALIIYASKNYQVKSYGITLSDVQYSYAKDWIKREGLEELCTVELKDYRELEGKNKFDKIVSVGMFEHVGIKNLVKYFEIVKGLLKDNGLFLNHGITVDGMTKRRGPGTKFMNTFVFPRGELTNIGYINHIMEKVGFEILDVESLRLHYAKTLKIWRDSLEENREKALEIVGERIYRIWNLYMAACAHGFEKGNINIYQVLLSKVRSGVKHIPLTRAHLYTKSYI